MIRTPPRRRARARRQRPSYCVQAVHRRRALTRHRDAAARNARLLELEGMILRAAGFAGLLVLAFYLTGCPGDSNNSGNNNSGNNNVPPQGQPNQFPQAPVGGPVQPCPNSEVVEVELLDEQIQVPLKNRTVIVTFSDGSTQSVVTDQNGIASVCVRPGQTFTVKVDDTHALSETHVPR